MDPSVKMLVATGAILVFFCVVVPLFMRTGKRSQPDAPPTDQAE